MKVVDTRRFGRAGFDVTLLGYGSAPIGNIFRPIAARDAEALVDAAWDLGMRLYDTAPMYGHGLSEHRLGHALLPRVRDEYVLVTKVGRTLTPARRGEFDTGVWVDTAPFRASFDYSYDAVMRQVEDSLQRMCQDRFDVLLVHDVDRYTHGADQPERFKEALAGAFPALVKLRDEGVVRAIGIGVNEADVCADAVRLVDVDCVLLAGRYTLLEQEPQDDLLPLCVERDIAVILGGVFNSGILATGTTPSAKFNYEAAPEEILARVRQLEDVCGRHDVPLPAAAIQFAAAHPAVAAVLLGARTLAQQAANAAWLEFPIPSALWDDLRKAQLIREDTPAPC